MRSTRSKKTKKRTRFADQRYLEPARIVHVSDSEAPPSRTRLECACCEKLFSGGQVVDGPVTWNGAAQMYETERTLYCDHCDHLQVWGEALDREHHKTGVPIEPPVFITAQSDIDAFLSEHPEAKGTIDA